MSERRGWGMSRGGDRSSDRSSDRSFDRPSDTYRDRRPMNRDNLFAEDDLPPLSSNAQPVQQSTYGPRGTSAAALMKDRLANEQPKAIIAPPPELPVAPKPTVVQLEGLVRNTQ